VRQLEQRDGSPASFELFKAGVIVNLFIFLGGVFLKYVIGIDLGTSSVKAILVNREGAIGGECSKPYPLIQEKSGYSEQDPELWVKQTTAAIQELLHTSGISGDEVEGLSFSGQMHGLVLLNEEHRVIRNAILWNDTRTTNQCVEIKRVLGKRLLEITRNPALEGFTLPKLLWVRSMNRNSLLRLMSCCFRRITSASA